MVVQSPKCVQESSISNGEVSLRTDSEFQKRVSPRLKEKQRVEKELLVRRRVELLDDNEEVVASAVGGGGGGSEEKSSEKKKKTYKRRCIGGNVNQEEEKKVNGEVAKSAEDSEAGNGAVKGVVAEKSDIAKVKETIRLFNKYYLLLVQVCYYFCPLFFFWFLCLILCFVCLNVHVYFGLGV